MKTKMTVLALSLSMFWTALAFAAPPRAPRWFPLPSAMTGRP